MNLVLAILHVNQAAVLAIEQFRIALAAFSLTALLEDVVVFAIAGEQTVVRLALRKVSITLHDGFEVDAEINVLLHNSIKFLILRKICFMFHRALPVSSFKYGVR